MQRENAEKYIDKCYFRETYKKTYELMISPINGPNNWPSSDIFLLMPPEMIKLSGRTKEKRIMEKGEKDFKTSTNGALKLSRVGLNTNKLVSVNSLATTQKSVPKKLASM